MSYSNKMSGIWVYQRTNMERFSSEIVKSRSWAGNGLRHAGPICRKLLGRVLQSAPQWMFCKNGGRGLESNRFENSLKHIVLKIHISIKSTEKVFSEQNDFIWGHWLKQTHW